MGCQAVSAAASSETASSGGATPPAADTAWHPIPTAEQDQIYTEQTQTNAAHPGLLVEGRDGYIFFGDAIQTNFAQAMGRRFYSLEEVWRTVDAVKSRKQWLANRGIASEFVVVPATWSVYSDKMPAWADGQIMPHILDQLIAADPALFPDLRPDLKSWRATAETYPRLNSHWTPFGAFIGFQALVDHLKSDQPGVSGLPVPV